MAMRNVRTKTMQYVAIGGTTFDHVGEDLNYVNIRVTSPGGGDFAVAPVDVRELLTALRVEGYITDFTLPDKPLTQVERVARALMGYADAEQYTVASFRAQEDYEDYLIRAKTLLDGDN